MRSTHRPLVALGVAAIALFPQSAGAGAAPPSPLRPNVCAVMEEVCEEGDWIFPQTCKAYGFADQTPDNYWDPTGEGPKLVIAYAIGIDWSGNCPSGDGISCTAVLRVPGRPLSPAHPTFGDNGVCENRYIAKEAWVRYGETITFQNEVYGANIPDERECTYIVGTTIEDCTNVSLG